MFIALADICVTSYSFINEEFLKTICQDLELEL